MKKEKLLILVSILFVSSVLAPAFIYPTHAAAGEVCIADLSSSPCPTSPPVLSGPVGQLIRVGVFVSSSAGLNAFDITLRADSTKLKPQSVDLTGTVLLSSGTTPPSIVLLCTGGTLIAGTVCSVNDTADTLHVAAASAPGSPLTTSPTTGLLFTAVYNVTSATATGGISVGFPASCGRLTSVVGGVCVTIANGTGSSVPETSQAATFDNSASATMATVTLSANPSSLGPVFPNTPNRATIVATAKNGYPGAATDQVTFSATSTSGLIVTIPINICTTTGTSCSVNISLTGTTAGTYTTTVSGTYATLDSHGNPDTLSSVVTIRLVVTDYSVTVNPTIVTFNSGTTGTTAVTVASLNGFVGNVGLNARVGSPTGLSVSFTRTSISLIPGGTGMSTAIFSYSLSTPFSGGRVAINANSSSVSHRVILTVNINTGADFSISANPTVVNVKPGVQGLSTITTTPVGGFNATIALRLGLAIPSLSCSLGSTSIPPLGGSTPLTCTGSMGTYSVVVIGSGGQITHSVNVTFIVSTGVAGLVCIAQSGATSCPFAPPNLSGQTPPTTQQLRVAVVLSQSAPLNAFDITLLTNHTLLKPAGVDLTGGLLTTPNILAECIGGHGNGCLSTDNADTLHLAVAIQGLLISPVTGLLFTAIYNITGVTGGTTIGYQTGCLSSIAGTTLCVDIADGSLTPVPEMVQTASFSDVPGFSITANPTSLQLQLGASSVSSINVTSINGFTGTVGLTTLVTPTGPTASFSLSSLLVPPSGSNLTLLTLTAPTTVAPGDYTVKVSGTRGSLTAAVTLKVTIVGRDFSISANPTTVSLNAGSNFNATITVSSLSGFSGPVHLSTTVVPAGLGVVLSLTIVTLTPGGTGTSGLVLMPNTAASGSFTVSVTGTNGTESHTVTVTVNVKDFAIFMSPSSMTIQPNIAGLTNIQVNSRNGFAGIVTLSTSAPIGLTATANPSVLSLLPNASFYLSTLSVLASNSIAAGNYTVIVSASSNGIVRSAVEHVLVIIVQRADFTFLASPPTISVRQGNGGNTTMVATSTGGFVGSIFISLTSITPIGPNGLASEGWINTITITSPGGTGQARFSVQTNANTQPGNYTIVMTGTSGALVHSLTIVVIVMPSPSFQINAIPNIVVVAKGFSNSSNIQVSANSLFSGTVSLTATSLPPGLTLSLTSSSVTLAPNQMTNVTLTILAGAATTASFYEVNVTGVSGAMSQFVFISVRVEFPPTPDFSVTITPAFASVLGGNGFNYTIMLTSLNGFSGSVFLTASSSPSITDGPSLTLVPTVVSLSSGGTTSATLRAMTLTTTPGLFYTLTVNAGSGSLFHFSSVSLQVFAPPDETPTARFSISPTNPVAGQTVTFDGSASSDPDGSVQQWSWNFGDNFIDFGPVVSHSYNNPGTYTVMLSIRDSSNQFGSANMTIVVSPKPPHDVSVNNVNVFPNRAVATQQIFINVQIENNGLNNETVSVTAYANNHAIQTLNGIFVQGCPSNTFFGFCYPYSYVTIIWDTTGVIPGNYTISATVSLPAGETDPTPADNSLADGIVTVLPAPVVTLTPSMGPDGTQVVVHGTGFPSPRFNPYGPSFDYIDITFDDMFEAFTITRTGAFNVTIDVPLSQSGLHLIKAIDENSLARGVATFTVTPSATGSLAVSIDSGTLYFPGDTAVVYVLTSLNGAPVSPTGLQLQLVLFKPDGTNSTLKTTFMGAGLYKATYTISSTGPLGTYAIQASAHEAGPLDASALRSFEVKPTWLSQNGKSLVSGATIAGVIGLVAFAWRQGYLPRKKNEPVVPSFQTESFRQA